ncbi:hypothetical protein BCR39DRAFT_545725 [Naematelia encephala]|uniref:Major facilitator superfamily domain-containing protein n=1 Tax=Naematelia encephala TaxID=71784 RepID=A0A1Y2ARP6_9TREE|nr:hypothetical protein BCR39DRAFT_545725 [Naematelia encephala]
MSYKDPSSNPSIELDPLHNGATVRRAFLLEAILNLCSFPLLTHPHIVLPYILKHPDQLNTSTLLFARLFGGLIIGGLTPALLAGYPNTRNAIESRKTVYILLGLGEVVLIPLLLLEGLKSGKQQALTLRATMGAVACLAPPLLWRIYVLFWNKGLLGRYREVKQD